MQDRRAITSRRQHVIPAPPGLSVWVLNQGHVEGPVPVLALGFSLLEVQLTTELEVDRVPKGTGTRLVFEEPDPFLWADFPAGSPRFVETWVLLPFDELDQQWRLLGVDAFFDEDTAHEVAEEQRGVRMNGSVGGA